MATPTQNNTERWLVHENIRFRYQKDADSTFKITITDQVERYNGIEIFEPKKQPGVIVVGLRCMFKTNQNFRFLNMTEAEQQLIRDDIASYCNSIGAVHRFLTESGRNMVGVYTVIDAKERHNQADFIASLDEVCVMADRLKEHMRLRI